MKQCLKFQQNATLLGGGYEAFYLYKHLVEKLEPSCSFLLESVHEETRKPQYSFICFEPDYLLKIKNTQVKITNMTTARGEKILQHIEATKETKNNQVKVKDRVDDRVKYDIKALDLLEKYFPKSNTQRPEFFPRQVFFGGYLGYLGYDIVAPWVGYRPNHETPDAIQAMQTTVLTYDHLNQKLILIDNSLGETNPLIPEIEKALKSYKSPPKKRSRNNIKDIETKSNTSKEEFEEMVLKTKEHIFSGDIFQAVISRRNYFKTKATPLTIYEALRTLNPSPYLYLLDFGEIKIIGSSPEALISIAGRKLTTVPIAGTRKRGKNKTEDLKLEKELISDPKERAEHVMLVDLARNDLAKVSVPGSVTPVEFMSIRRYKHVMHIVTILESVLKRNLNTFDAMKSIFPAGTVSGAPKLRAMQIISQLEKEARSIYAGSIGYFALNGDSDQAITIRTIVKENGKYSVQAGGGIVADSKPHLEWKETENKMKSLLKSVEIAEEDVKN